MTTNRQKAAIRFCEEWLQIEFKGDINNFKQVSDFLGKYLEMAKQHATELECEYKHYMMELWD